ncbi:hypothetical protein BK123_14480 [Paenibacillus lautus]|uniref:Uncharacterized protein n=1 Tax=Paenibacillus lautus TaxID=1401 RepID=A0A1R1B324_PAELA|nr:hypothetical protein BK123_14480 [Paenibacillus lautus]
MEIHGASRQGLYGLRGALFSCENYEKPFLFASIGVHGSLNITQDLGAGFARRGMNETSSEK